MGVRLNAALTLTERAVKVHLNGVRLLRRRGILRTSARRAGQRNRQPRNPWVSETRPVRVAEGVIENVHLAEHHATQPPQLPAELSLRHSAGRPVAQARLVASTVRLRPDRSCCFNRVKWCQRQKATRDR